MGSYRSTIMVASGPVGILGIRILQDRPISHRKLVLRHGEVPRISLPGTWLNRPQGCIRLCYVPSFTDGKGFASKGRFLLVKLTVLYGHPDDPDAFEEYYANTHMPLVDKCPTFRGMRRPGLSQRQTVASRPT